MNLVDRPPAAGASPAHRALWAALERAAPEATQRIGVRPEHLRVGPAGEGVAATIVLAEHLGDSSILHLRVEGMDGLLNAKVVATPGQCEAGETVGLVPDASRALAFDADGIRLP